MSSDLSRQLVLHTTRRTCEERVHNVSGHMLKHLSYLLLSLSFLYEYRKHVEDQSLKKPYMSRLTNIKE